MQNNIRLSCVINEIISLKRNLLSDFHHGNKFPLNSTETRTLMFIFKNEGKSMNYYSKTVGLGNGSFTYAADILEKKGLILRKNDLLDRRRTVLFLTDEGRRITKELEIQLETHFSKKLEALSSEEKTKLIEAIGILKKINDKISMEI